MYLSLLGAGRNEDGVVIKFIDYRSAIKLLKRGMKAMHRDGYNDWKAHSMT